MFGKCSGINELDIISDLRSVPRCIGNLWTKQLIGRFRFFSLQTALLLLLNTSSCSYPSAVLHSVFIHSCVGREITV